MDRRAWQAAVYGIPGGLQSMGSLAGCGLWDPWRAAVCGIPGGLQSVGSQSQARLSMHAQVYSIVILLLLCSKLLKAACCLLS